MPVGHAGCADPTEVKQALEAMGVIATPYGPFSCSASDHNGFKNLVVAMVVANSQQPNGGLLAARA